MVLPGYSDSSFLGNSSSVILSMGPVDYDAKKYFSDAQITSSTDKTAIYNFISTLKAYSIWNKIIDLGIFLGSNLTNSLVKLKHPEVYPSLLNDGSSVLTDSNYSATLGLNTSSTNRRANTQIIPQDHGLSKDNICIGVSIISDLTTGAVGSVFLDNRSSGAAGIFLGKGSIGMNGGGLQVVHPITANSTYTLTASSNGTVVYVKDYSNIIATGNAAPSVTYDSILSLFTGRASGAAVSTTGSVGAYYVSNYLGYDEIVILNKALEVLLRATGRKTQTLKDCVTFGDSITYGFGVTATQRWSALYASSVGLHERNCGLSGSQWRASTATVPSGYGSSRSLALLNYDILGGGKIVFLFGVNDCRLDTGSVNYTDFKNKLIERINQWKAHGVYGSNIIVGSMPWIDDGTPQERQDLYVNAALQAAQQTGVYYADVNAYVQSHGGADNLQADNIHYNAAGNIVISEALLTATAA
jgi:lysophospholipase L1-like esterase